MPGPSTVPSQTYSGFWVCFVFLIVVDFCVGNKESTSNIIYNFMVIVIIMIIVRRDVNRDI